MAKIKLKEVILVSLVIFVALFLRLYRIESQMTFLGDEGRDVRIVRDLLHGNLVFIGPQTSIGNMYLGPLYYYMMAPALFVSAGNPVGPAVMIALLGGLTTALIWYFGRRWFSSTAGLIAALLFALSPVAIVYGRSSWNPNPMPFFALICIWGIWQFKEKLNFRYLWLVSISFAAALQMHYLGLLLIPTLGLVWLIVAKKIWSDKQQRSIFIRHSLIALGLFLLLMSPLALFDLKHNFMNFKAFKAFFTDRQTTVNFNPLRSDRFGLIVSQVSQDFVLARQNLQPLIVGIALIVAAALLVVIKKRKPAYMLLVSWLLFGIMGLIVYKQHVYDHYYGFLFPAIYLFLGVFLATLMRQKNLIFKLVSLALLIFLVFLNLKYSSAWDQPNRQLARTREAVQLIIKQSSDQPFNFGLIAKQNYDESYRYFLENYHAPMYRGEDKITDQLFVICEDGDKCQPEGNPQYQIAIFGPSHVVGEWHIDYLKIYRLFHTK